jgi:hypothetical protein
MAIYRPKYRDPRTGRLVESDICWFEFEFEGERIRAKQAHRKRKSRTPLAFG